MEKLLKEKRSLETSENFEINDENTIIISFASPTPYMRSDFDYTYNEILVISEDAVKWDRLVDQKCPLLLDHDMTKQIGVIEKAYIEGDKLKAVVRFSKNEFAQSILSDVKDGIRRNVSFGYIINEYKTEKVEGQPDNVYITNYEPYEISIVSCPADSTVGYKRNLEEDEHMKKSKKNIKEEKISTKEISAEEFTKEIEKEAAEMTEEELQEQAKQYKEANAALYQKEDDKKEEEVAEVTEEVADEVQEEEKEVETEEETQEEVAPEDKTEEKEITEEEDDEADEIRAAGELIGEEELAEECIKEKKSLQEFKNLIKSKRNINNFTKSLNKEVKNMTKFSISKAIRNACKQYKEDVSDSIETQVIEANRRDLHTLDNVSEFDVIVTNSQLRALGPSATVGAELINTDYLPGEYTPALRPQITLEQTGYKAIPVNGNAISFAINTSGAVAAMYDLDGELADSDMKFALKELRPRKEGVCVPIPYSLLLQGRPEVDAIVEQDIVNALAELKDKMILIGSGSDNQPSGIINTDGVNTMAPSAIFSWAGVCTAEKLIRDSNDYSTNLAWVMNSNSKLTFETTLKAANIPGYICEEDKIKGYPVYVNNALDDNTIILGNFSELIVANFDGLFLKVDDITYIKRGAVQVIATACFDSIVRRPKSFTVTKNA